MTDRENYLQTVRMGTPERMPYAIKLKNATWEYLGRELEDVLIKHPQTWPGFVRGATDWRNLEYPPSEDPEFGDYTDSWGCVWRTARRGFIGSVVEHPVTSADDIPNVSSPNPDSFGHMGPVDWAERAAAGAIGSGRGRRSHIGALDHGFHFLRLEYLCGFENTVVWFHESAEQMRLLADVIHRFNVAHVRKWCSLGIEEIRLGEDLGSQQSSFLGPTLFGDWVEPYYRELYEIARNHDVLVYQHSDGNIMDIADRLVSLGIDVINPQDCVNGVDELARAFKGRLCIDLDFDRQYHIPFGNKREIEELVEREVKTLGSSSGGLIISAEIRGPIPPENIDTLASALERYSTFWFE